MKKLTRVFKRALVNVAIAALQGWQAKSLPVIRSLPRELLFKNPQICDREHYHPFHLGSWQKKTRQEKKKKREYKIDFHSKNERMTHQMALLNKKFTFTGK